MNQTFKLRKPGRQHVILKRIVFVLILVFLYALSTYAQDAEETGKEPASSDSIFIDKIEIKKNWISWDLIIKNELLFAEEEWVRYGEIDTSMNKVWNIGNFADVDYTIEESNEGNTMTITALDAVKFYPLFTIDHSSENDYNYRLGLGDDNFLGSNTKLKIAWQKNPTGVSWDFKIGLPRQLLYKNMTTTFGFNTGTETKRFLERVITTDTDGTKTAEYNILMLAPYNKMEIYAELGNPWHLDYQYRFSPDLSLRFKKHVINHSILGQEDYDLNVHVPENTYHFLDMKVSESIGTVNTKRHRKDGYTARVNYGLSLGLNGTQSYQEFVTEAEYHKTFNDIIQFSSWVKTGYSTANDQYRFIKGSSDVLGLRTGEIFGKAFYSAYGGGHFTWLNTKWISLENAYFVNFGTGTESYGDLFSTQPSAAVGTYLEIQFPIAPIAVFRFTFMYAGPGSEWFKFHLK